MVELGSLYSSQKVTLICEKILQINFIWYLCIKDSFCSTSCANKTNRAWIHKLASSQFWTFYSQIQNFSLNILKFILSSPILCTLNSRTFYKGHFKIWKNAKTSFQKTLNPLLENFECRYYVTFKSCIEKFAKKWISENSVRKQWIYQARDIELWPYQFRNLPWYD